MTPQSQIWNDAELLADRLKLDFGYDTVTLCSVRISRDMTVYAVIDMVDDFQKNLPFDMRYASNYSESIDLYGFDAARWPRRKERELRVLARQMATTAGMEEKLVSLEALAFVETLKPSLEELRRQIPDQR